MARRKVAMRRIPHAATRRTTYKKRRNGVIKKATEFATLCGVDTALVLYGEGESEPVTWPSPEEAARVMNRFKEMPDMGRYKNMLDTGSLMKQQMERMNEKVLKLQQGTNEREKKLLLIQALAGRLPGGVEDLTPEELSSLGWMVGNHLQTVHNTLRELGLGLPAAPAPAPQLPLPLASLPPVPFTTDAGQASQPQPQPQQGWPAPQLQLPLPPVPFTTDAGQASQPQQGWPMGMPGAGGDLGALAYGGFGGAFGSFGGVGDAGAGTSAAGGGMPLLLGNVPAGFFPWGGDAGAGPSSSRRM